MAAITPAKTNRTAITGTAAGSDSRIGKSRQLRTSDGGLSLTLRVSGSLKNQTIAAEPVIAALIHNPPRKPKRSVKAPPSKAPTATPVKNHIWNCPLFRPRVASVETSRITVLPPIQSPDQAAPHKMRPIRNGTGPKATA